MSDSILVAILGVVANGLVTWGVVRTQLSYMRAQINAAHRRLDKLNAPAAGGDAIPET